jgi:NAD(P)H-nitrite reductase large subunit
MAQHLILGNGIAAISAARAIKSVSPQDAITIVSNESYPAYSPTLITYYLMGKIGFKNIFISDKASYRKNGIDLRLNSKIVKVEADQKKVLLGDGQFLSYDNLLIATGARPAIPPIDGAPSPGVFTLYTADDAKGVVRFLRDKKRVAVIGGGLVGLQAAGALTNSGRKVFLIEMKDRISYQTLDVEGAAIVENMLRQWGVDTHIGQGVSAIHDVGDKKVVLLTSGSKLVAEAVILATGTQPNVEFLEASGIRMANGIIVDGFCRTNIDHVYAAGDVALARDEYTGQLVPNATWPNAIKQGRTAGLNMAGKQILIPGNIRFNATTLSGLVCVSIGSMDAVDGPVEEAVYRDGPVYRKLFLRNGFPVGAILIGDVEGAGAIANMIELQHSGLNATITHGLGKVARSDRDYYRLIRRPPIVTGRPLA